MLKTPLKDYALYSKLNNVTSVLNYLIKGFPVQHWVDWSGLLYPSYNIKCPIPLVIIGQVVETTLINMAHQSFYSTQSSII